MDEKKNIKFYRKWSHRRTLKFKNILCKNENKESDIDSDGDSEMCNTFDLRVIVNDDGCRIFRLYIINLVPKNVCEQWTKIDSFGFDSTNKNIDKIWKCLDSNLSIINCCYTLNCLDKNLLDYDIRTRQFIFPFISQEISVIIENYSKFEKYVEKHLKKYILTNKIEHYSCRYKEFLKFSSSFLLTK